MVISSSSNERIKEIKKLYDKKYRNEKKQYIVEGIKIVEEAFLSNQRFISIVVCNEILENVSINKSNIEKLILAKKELVCEVSKNVFESLADTKTPQGILAVIEMPKYTMEDILKNTHNVLLDNIQDAGNLGTIIRSARAFGFDGIILTPNCVDVYNSKVLRATMGNIFDIKYYEIEENVVDILHELRDNKYMIYCTTLENAESVYTTQYSDEVVVVIGNEANGISEEVLAYSDKNIIIPMKNNTESLNASVAASIVMSEISQRSGK